MLSIYNMHAGSSGNSLMISFYLKIMHSNIDIILKDSEFLIRMYIDNPHVSIFGAFKPLHHYQ